MKCITCQTMMKCTSDVNDISTRIDFMECPLCHSKADIVYGNNGEYISEVNWRRGNVKELPDSKSFATDDDIKNYLAKNLVIKIDKLRVGQYESVVQVQVLLGDTIISKDAVSI